MIIRKSQAEIEGMARAGALLHETLQLCADALEPGVSMLELDESVSRERLLKRAREEGRPDDTPAVIDERLSTYRTDTAPVVDHYLATGKLVKVHAERSIDEVWAEIQDALEQVQARA